MIFVDGVDIGDVADVALRDRRMLSADGIFIIVATVSEQDGSSVVAPEVLADGEVNYVYADFSTRGLLYGVYRPAQDLESEEGPENEADLRNTTLYPYPGGYEEIDPVTVALADIGLDVPGVDRRLVNFCAGILGVEAVDDLGMLRETFDAAWPDYQDTIRAGLKHLVANQPLTVEQWFGLTYVPFPDQRELRAYLAQVYAYLFDDFEAMPLAPQ